VPTCCGAVQQPGEGAAAAPRRRRRTDAARRRPPPPRPQATDCLYSGAYAVLFATALCVSVAATGAPEALHLLNLVPAAAAAVDVFENSLMIALLAGPRADLARLAAAASAAKWRLLMATAAVVAGAGMYCVAKGAGQGAARKAKSQGPDASAGRDVAARGGRKSARRA
jgi:hypothetical protein